jgi:hypothetical protein
LGNWGFIGAGAVMMLSGAGLLAFIEHFCHIATSRLDHGGRHRTLNVLRHDPPGDRPAPVVTHGTPGPGAGRPDQLEVLADEYRAQAPANRELGERLGFLPDPAGADPAETRPVPVIDPGMDLAAVLGPAWCSRGWHDGDCCEGSRTQWGGTVGPRPYLGTS